MVRMVTSAAGLRRLSFARNLGSGSDAANNQYFHQLTSLSFHKRSHEERHKVLFSFLLFYYTMFLGGMVEPLQIFVFFLQIHIFQRELPF